MRLRTQDVTLVGMMASSLMLFVGCGGTSSETPEPARPDSWQLKLRHQHQLAAAGETEPSRQLNRADNFEPAPTPRSTWGAEGAKVKKAPVARLPDAPPSVPSGTATEPAPKAR